MTTSAATISTLSSPPGAALASTRQVVPSIAGASAARLAAAYEECGRVVRERARNFYYGLRLTPEPRRSAIYSIYAWMREADDQADAEGSLPERRERLKLFRARTERVLRGEVLSESDPSYWLAFAATVRSYPIDASIFTDMLDGLDEDLVGTGYDTQDELARYCYRVAGTAGLACVWVWGIGEGREAADTAVIRDLAIKRGEAFQRTNILRDLGEDLDETPPRVYVPRELLASVGLTHESLRSWREPERCDALVRQQAAIARRFYDESAGLEALIDPACAPTLWAMTRIYSGILEIIEREPRRVVESRRIRLPSAKKASIAIAATLRSKVGAW